VFIQAGRLYRQVCNRLTGTALGTRVAQGLGL